MALGFQTSDARAAGFIELGFPMSEGAALGFMPSGCAPVLWGTMSISKAATASEKDLVCRTLRGFRRVNPFMTWRGCDTRLLARAPAPSMSRPAILPAALAFR